MDIVPHLQPCLRQGFHPSVYLSLYPSIRLSVYPSSHLSIGVVGCHCSVDARLVQELQGLTCVYLSFCLRSTERSIAPLGFYMKT